MQDNCGKCADSTKSVTLTRSSLISGLLVVIIPKCPICVMAYTSAVTMCGGPDMYMHGNNWVSYIPILLALAIVTMIAFNWRGARSWFALTLATVGSFFVVLTHQLIAGPEFYTYGTILLFFSIWLNSNLLATIDYLRKPLQRILSWQK